MSFVPLDSQHALGVREKIITRKKYSSQGKLLKIEQVPSSMEIEEIKQGVLDLEKRIHEENELLPHICNAHIEDLNDVIGSLQDLGYRLPETLRGVQQLEGDWITGEITTDEMNDTMQEVSRQVKRLKDKLGIKAEASDHNTETAPSTIPQIHIHNSPSISQTATASATASAEVEVSALLREFESEISKDNPDNDKARGLLQTIMSKGKEYALPLLDVIIKNIDRIRFGGLF